ncbi:MAG: hypothetical protein HZA50_04080 [Planctomycetes bacterium]|nr:hypothetical protein [Planctomycetota bacterium]
MLWLCGLMTLGIGALGMWLSTKRWPRLLDQEGATLRNGKRLLWKDVTEIIPVTVVDPRGRRITGRLDIKFGKDKLKIVPQSLAEGQAVMDFIAAVLKTDLATG